MMRLAPVVLAAVLLAAGCGADPAATGSLDPEVEQVALVRAERLVGQPGSFDRLAVHGSVAPLVDEPAPGGVGRRPRAFVASFVAEGEWRLVFKSEAAPCLVDCAEQRYWYFAVSPHGEPTLVGRHAVVASGGVARVEGDPRWGFPGEAERQLLAVARAGGR